MAEALRRLLWLLPIFGLGSLLLFALLSWGQTAPVGSDPLFFNPRPRGIREHAALAMEAVARGDDPNASARLATLGGAALPFVLPRLGELSEIEQQRVALARAYINRPDILFADEPTGNLDQRNAEVVEHLLFDLNREHGTTLVVATHNLALAEKSARLLMLKHGTIDEQRCDLPR